MSGVYSIGGPVQTTELPAKGANVQAIAATKAYIAGMKAAGLGTPDDLNAGGTGWTAGIELEAAVKAAGSINSAAVIKQLDVQKLVTGGGGQVIFWNRSKFHHANITNIITAMVTITSSGGQKVVK